MITIYSSAGGLKGGAWVNMVQLSVKMAGFAVALPLALSAVGGWSAVHVDARSARPTTGTSGQAVARASSTWRCSVPAFIVSPGLLQKLYGRATIARCGGASACNALGLLLYAIIPVVLGMIARVRFPDAGQSPDLALPMILMHGLPLAVGTLGLAAVFSAEVSAADAMLFMLTTSLSQDLYKRFVNRAADEQQVLLVARVDDRGGRRPRHRAGHRLTHGDRRTQRSSTRCSA